MSKLEDELNAARNGYESLRYPGDLAAQVLPKRPRRWRWAVAAAAAIVLLTVVAPHANGPGDDPVVERGQVAHRPAEAPKLTFTGPMMPNVSLGGMPSVTAVPISMLSMGDVPNVSLDLSGLNLSPNMQKENSL